MGRALGWGRAACRLGLRGLNMKKAERVIRCPLNAELRSHPKPWHSLDIQQHTAHVFLLSLLKPSAKIDMMHLPIPTSIHPMPNEEVEFEPVSKQLILEADFWELQQSKSNSGKGSR